MHEMIQSMLQAVRSTIMFSRGDLLLFTMAAALGALCVAAPRTHAHDGECNPDVAEDGRFYFGDMNVEPWDAEIDGVSPVALTPYRVVAGVPPWPHARSPYRIETASPDDTGRDGEFYLLLEEAP